MNSNKYLLKISLLLLLLVLGFLTSEQAFAVDISTSVDRNPVNLDESFKIFFTASETPDGDPDFAPLERDFAVLNQGQSSSSSRVNGTYSKSISWTVEVTANKSGKLTVPTIKFGKDSSKPLSIEVTQGTPASDNNASKDLFLEVKATPEKPFIQSQVIYTVQVYSRVRFRPENPSPPEAEDSLVEFLGESQHSTLINGVSYNVYELKYAIFPQKSGVVTIKPFSFRAEVEVDSQLSYRDIFGSPMIQTKRVLSKEIILNIKPAPANFTGKHWLAAEKLELTQDWSGDIQQMKVGEPLTRTLSLRGEGTTVGQLPELNTLKTDINIKAYPDQPVLNEQKQPEGISASRQEKIALIPSTAGKHVLPAIEIPWFNIKTQKMEIARVPETTINVIGGGENQPTTVAPSQATVAPSIPQATQQTEIKTQIPADTKEWHNNAWLWASLFLALGWLATVIYFMSKKPKYQLNPNQEADLLRQETNEKESIKKLKQACEENDIQAAKNALLDWGKLKFAVSSLGTIAGYCDARLRDEILHLNQILYGKDSSQWIGKKLLQAFTENKARAKIAGNEESILEPLNRL